MIVVKMVVVKMIVVMFVMVISLKPRTIRCSFGLQGLPARRQQPRHHLSVVWSGRRPETE